MIRSFATAQSDLAHLLDRLQGCIRAALQEYASEHGSLRHKYFGTAEPSVIHSLMKWHIEAAFPPGNPDGVVPITTRGNLFLVLIGSNYRVKLKKMNRGWRTSNVRTQSVIAFTEQRRQIELIASPTNLHLGYRPKSTAEVLTSEVWIACPDGRRNPHWAMELVQAAAPLPVPLRQPATAESAGKKHVKPRVQEGTDSALRKADETDDNE